MKVACVIRRIWPYPHMDDNTGPIRWAWSCACGTGGVAFKDEEAARTAARKHHDGPQPAVGAWP